MLMKIQAAKIIGQWEITKETENDLEVTTKI